MLRYVPLWLPLFVLGCVDPTVQSVGLEFDFFDCREPERCGREVRTHGLIVATSGDDDPLLTRHEQPLLFADFSVGAGRSGMLRMTEDDAAYVEIEGGRVVFHGVPTQKDIRLAETAEGQLRGSFAVAFVDGDAFRLLQGGEAAPLSGNEFVPFVEPRPLRPRPRSGARSRVIIFLDFDLGGPGTSAPPPAESPRYGSEAPGCEADTAEDSAYDAAPGCDGVDGSDDPSDDSVSAGPGCEGDGYEDSSGTSSGCETDAGEADDFGCEASVMGHRLRRALWFQFWPVAAVYLFYRACRARGPRRLPSTRQVRPFRYRPFRRLRRGG